jgi:EAL and modified HD-GYP domain-containing signal transduction protein
MPFVTTGVRRVADIDEAYQRGAMASVGWPMDDTEQRPNCRLRPDQGNLLELLRVASDHPDTGTIAHGIRRDPVLAFKLLRMVNSDAFETSEPVASIQRAVQVLGREKTMRWLTLSLESASEHLNALPLVRAATLRGLFLENLSSVVPTMDAATRDELFVTGAFSLLDRITGTPIPRLMGPVGMGGNVTDAIVHRQGPYAPYLAVIESIERSDPMSIRRHLDALGIPIFDCNQALMRALAATQKLDAEQENRSEETIFSPV